MEGQSQPNRAHQGFRGPIALAVHGRQRRRRRHGNLTWDDNVTQVTCSQICIRKSYGRRLKWF